jgi:hypothetical protein
MSRPVTFTQASLRRAIAAAQSAGLKVIGIRADGTVMVSEAVEDGATPLDSREASLAASWDDA